MALNRGALEEEFWHTVGFSLKPQEGVIPNYRAFYLFAKSISHPSETQGMLAPT